MAIVLLGLLLTALAVTLTVRSVRRDRDLRFETLALDARTTLERRIASYGETLFGLRSLFAVEATVARDRFHDFVALADVHGRFPGVQTLAFARLVRRADVAAFEERVRRDTSLNGSGYPSFRVRPVTANVDLFVVDYLEPLARNEAAFGFDLGSEPTRRRAVEEARDTGDLVATAPIRLVQETGRQRGFLLTLAVYEGGSVPATAPARRRRFLGLVDAAFRVDDMLAGVLGQSPGVRIEEIFDVGRTVESEPDPLAAAGILLDAGDDVSALRLDSLPPTHEVLDLNVGSRRWRILMVPSSPALAAEGRFLPWLVGASGAGLSAMLAALILSFARSRTRALALASEMTADLRAREHELEEANRRLETSNQSIREFVAIVSHDMRSPLGTVLGFATHLLDHWEDTAEERRRSGLETIRRQAAQLARLVNDLLATSEIDAGMVRPRDEEVDVSAAVRRVLDELQETGVRLEAPAGLIARVDGSHLARIVTNLVENALKYGAPPVEIEARAEGECVELRVRDAGPGVPDAFAPRLFERFARKDVRPSSVLGGTGLGLAIVRGLARANAGDAWYERNAPKGACFVVRLRVGSGRTLA